MRILSGMRPTGKLHIGHLSVLQNWVRLQAENECFFFVANWHALTTAYDETCELRQNIREIVADWLAVGVDPERSTIFVQSHILEHAELHLLFSMFTPLSWLERVPTYKDQVRQLGEQGKDVRTYGFLGYPLLQAADILIYRAEAVPVGEDQLPHIELCREIARRFNYLYGTVFPEPQALLAETAFVPGIDGRKMSKSYGNVISLNVGPEDLGRLVRLMITDPARIHKTDPGHPEVCTVYAYHTIYSPTAVPEVEARCREGKIGCVACKALLSEALERILAPIRAKRAEIMARPGYVEEVIAAGDARAREEARATMALVREAMRI